MKDILWIYALVVFLTLKFTKLHGHITHCQCQGIKGIWSPTTKSCFKEFYTLRPKSRENALSFCLNSAPCGSRGRLAHIPNAHIFSHFKSCYECWLGVISIDGGTRENFDPKEWVYQDQLRNGTSFTVPLLWHSDEPYVNTNGACMRTDFGKFKVIQCSSKNNGALCEYVSDKYTESVDSGDLGVEETCKQIKGTWSAATQSCFKPYFAYQDEGLLSWIRGHLFCVQNAPCGTRGRLAHFPSSPIVALVATDRPMWVGAQQIASEWLLFDQFSIGNVESKTLRVWLPDEHANAEDICMAISNGIYTSVDCRKNSYGALCEYLAYDRKTVCENGEDSADECKYCLIGKHTSQAKPVYSTYTPGSTDKQPYSYKLDTSSSTCGTVRVMKNGVKDLYVANYNKTTAIQSLCGSDASYVILGRKTTAGQIKEKEIDVRLSTDIAMVRLNVLCNKGSLSAQVTSMSREMQKIYHTEIHGDIFSIECV